MWMPSVRGSASTPTKSNGRGALPIYRELIGFLPPRIEARINVTGALDPELLDMQERMRAHAMYPKCFDVKTAQLMLFGMLLMDMNDAAPLHGIAARRAGAYVGGDASRSEPCFSVPRLVGSQSRRGAACQYREARSGEEAAPNHGEKSD